MAQLEGSLKDLGPATLWLKSGVITPKARGTTSHPQEGSQ
jgi:hypothetical protein